MDIDQSQAAVLAEHHGTLVSFDGGAVTVRPLTMADLIAPGVFADLTAIGKILFNSLDGFRNAALDVDAILTILQPAIVPVGRLLARCLDKQLTEIPHWATPAVMTAFISQNFSGPRLKSWADPLRMVGVQLKKSGDPIASPKPASSSPSADTRDGAATPSTSSSSGSGPA